MIRKAKSIVDRKISDSFFLIDITDNYSGNECALYEINEIGLFIWRLIDGKNDVQDIIRIVKDAVDGDVSEELLENDIKEYMSELKEIGFLTLEE